MNLQFKSKSCLYKILFLELLLIIIAGSVFLKPDGFFGNMDYEILDRVYRLAVHQGYGPKPSKRTSIVYLAITDETYDRFKTSYIDRQTFSRINHALNQFNPAAVAYDIIFAFPGSDSSDKMFEASLNQIGKVYLPVGLAVSEKQVPFKWRNSPSYEIFKSGILGRPHETGTGSPGYASRALLQMDAFAKAGKAGGHISAMPDPDGVFRHLPMVLKVDDTLIPSFSLSIYLDQKGIRFDDLDVEWGKKIRIPTQRGNQSPNFVEIPIDRCGRTFVPFIDTMGNDFPVVEAHTLLELFQEDSYQGNFLDFFEGNVVIVCDIAAGASDQGHIPLEENASLVMLHTAMLNGLLTNSFYTKWPDWKTAGLLLGIWLLLGIASTYRFSWPLYTGGPLVLAGLAVLTWSEYIHFRLFPAAGAGLVTLGIFFSLVILMEAISSKERAFIRKTFSKYVPESVISELIANPEKLRLGGEEKQATVLFSDLVGFTKLSEVIAPEIMVTLLNDYFTEMTAIVFQENGTIDKYIGDALMAEFGIPIPFDDHADRAVAAALEMQRKLKVLRAAWKERGLPELHCRIGINTGTMIAGNMGSRNVFDYTVIGESVNLASRLEGENKRYDSRILISQSTNDALTPGRFRTRWMGTYPAGSEKPGVNVYEVSEIPAPID